ncbi:hypothetical protein llap_1677 [Limosa lapponica baueri]|uniref:Uncharacterized protein n=1 Tax=Limosa lapponica baueri TaxID=1758121 RepID=A0A2I0UPS0_LIMLA|nr:hypothetical protein llap_1677 [Limosa lapponica baueri]
MDHEPSLCQEKLTKPRTYEEKNEENIRKEKKIIENNRKERRGEERRGEERRGEEIYMKSINNNKSARKLKLQGEKTQ